MSEENRRPADAEHIGPALPSAGSATVRISISELTLSDSPRWAGESLEHIRLLADFPGQLPAIIVQRGSNRVIDGVHRVQAARLRGEDSVEARFFDGDDDQAFVLSVHANVEHGLPLSLSDRKRAVIRILGNNSHWSNRRIAPVVGLSAKTVAALRRHAGLAEPADRLGKDGRVRPLDAYSGRERVREILARDPDASLRAVAAAAGVSANTVRRVRNGSEPNSSQELATGRTCGRPGGHRKARDGDPAAVLRGLRNDPSLRFSESGRLLLSMLHSSTIDAATRDRLVSETPQHCASLVAYLAERSATMWRDIAAGLDQRPSGPA